jgi:hypothetical protein
MRFRREIFWNCMWSEYKVWIPVKRYAPYTLAVKLSGFNVWRHTGRRNWVNCAVLTSNNAGLRTVLYSRLSHRELRSSLRESHSFFSLPAVTAMASSQGIQFIQQMNIAWYIPFQIPLLTPHFTLFFSFFSYNITADVASKQQTTAFFLSTTVTRTRRHTELTDLCCAREHSVQFFVQFFYTVKLHGLT